MGYSTRKKGTLAGVSKLVGGFLSLQAVLYFFILLADFSVIRLGETSSLFKYFSVLLCLLFLSLLAEGGFHSVCRGFGALYFSVFVICLADFLLLFTPLFAPGVALYCLAQAGYHRFLTAQQRVMKRGLPSLTLLGAALGPSLFFSCLLLVSHSSASSLLFLFCLIYLFLVLSNLAILSRVQAGPFGSGLLLLMLCDIQVAMSYMGVSLCAPLIWLFYLPSLVLICLTASRTAAA